MFNRVKKSNFIQKIGSFFWPSMGWRRFFRYLHYRILRFRGTPSAISSGFALGAAISFIPAIGFHIIFAMGIAYIFRANIVAAAIGTVVGNPWTFPFIWLWTYWLGRKILGGWGNPMDLSSLMQRGLSEIFTVLHDNFADIFVPMMVGGILTAIIVWIGVYFSLYQAIHRYQNNKKQRQSNKENKIRLKNPFRGQVRHDKKVDEKAGNEKAK